MKKTPYDTNRSFLDRLTPDRKECYSEWLNLIGSYTDRPHMERFHYIFITSDFNYRWQHGMTLSVKPVTDMSVTETVCPMWGV